MNDIICLTEEQKKQIGIMDKSMWNIILIIAAVFISYFSLSVKRKDLICSFCEKENCGQTCNTDMLGLSSNILVVIATLYFFNLSDEARKNECTSKNNKNYLASLFVLIAAIIRFSETGNSGN